MLTERKAQAGLVVTPKKIGLFLATMLVASNIVGSGIFLLPATLAAWGSMTMLGWLAAAAGALLLARVFGRLGAYEAATGGACAYVTRGLGPFCGFQATFLYWLSCWTGNVAIAIAAIGYLADFVPALAGPLHLALGAVAVTWLMTGVNLLGARRVCQIQTFALGFGLAPILVVILGGMWFFHPTVFLQSWNVSGRSLTAALPSALVLMFWAFIGVESASIATAVVRDPERNVGRATLYGVALAAGVFLAACGIIMGLIPAAALARSTAPFADAVRVVFGASAGALVAAMALIKVVGSLGGWILITAQTGEAGAEHALFPSFFRRPRANFALIAVLMTAGILLSISPTLGQQFGLMISVSVVLTLVLYIYAALAIWPYARRAPAHFRHDRPLAAAAIAFCLFVILGSGRQLVLLALATLALTIPLYFWLRRRPDRSAIA